MDKATLAVLKCALSSSGITLAAAGLIAAVQAACPGSCSDKCILKKEWVECGGPIIGVGHLRVYDQLVFPRSQTTCALATLNTSTQGNITYKYYKDHEAAPHCICTDIFLTPSLKQATDKKTYIKDVKDDEVFTDCTDK